MQDAIVRRITVQRPISDVWEALTVAEQLAQWFGDSAEIDLRPGGELKLGWSEYDATAVCIIEEVDYPSRFSYRWNVGNAEYGDAWTMVSFTLEETEGGTTVQVVESGLAALPADLHAKTIEENTSGWKGEMDDLRRLLEAAPAR